MPAFPPPTARPTRERRSRRWSWSAPTTLIGVTVGACLAGGVSYAAISWTLAPSGHTGVASTPVVNLTVRAVAAPTPFPADLLYPGASGAVMATIGNPNQFPVTITALQLPSNSSYAPGYTDPSLATPRAGCAAATPSGVTWAHATSSTESTHTLISPITVPAHRTITVTFTTGATMGLAAPPACANSYFLMPPLPGLIATPSADSAAAPVSTDGWTH